MDKIIIFGDSSSFITNILLKNLLEIIRTCKDIELVAVVDTASSPPDPKILRVIKVILFELRKKIFNPQEKIYLTEWRFNNLYDLCRKFSVKVLVPPLRDVNSTEFTSYLKKELKPTIGFVMGCPQVIHKDLREAFEIMVNYHNSSLPQYRGVYATAWSIYFNDSFTGFSFHRISDKLDAGNILLGESFALSEKRTLLDWEIIKTFKASDYLSALIELAQQRALGTAQQGASSYFGQKEYNLMTQIDHPQELTFAEISKKLKAFSSLRINIHGRYYEVTDFSSKKNKLLNDHLSFITKDNIHIQVTRVCYLPWNFYKMYEWVKRKR